MQRRYRRREENSLQWKNYKALSQTTVSQIALHKEQPLLQRNHFGKDIIFLNNCVEDIAI